MKSFRFTPAGVCSRLITFDLDDENRIHHAAFVGGCHGNLQGICRLVEGQKAENVINRILGIRCGVKPTSCPDQLAKSLLAALAENNPD